MFQFFILLPLFISDTYGIIHGVQSARFETTSSASLFLHFPSISDDRRSFCGGVLIASNVVLTAAHCVLQNNTLATHVSVTVNDYNIYEKDKDEVKFSSRAIDVHLGYKGNDASDLAVIYLPHQVPICSNHLAPQVPVLPGSIRIGSHVKPNDISHAKSILLHRPITNMELFSSVCYIAGWGVTQSSNYSHIPFSMPLRLSKSNTAGTLHGTALNALTRPCSGDSGSPVFCYLRGMKYLVGIVASIGTYKDIPQRQLDMAQNEVETCNNYDAVLISDLRVEIDEIANTLEKRGLGEQLAAGQKTCYNI